MANVTTYSAFTDAQSQNDISRNVRQHRDLDLFFSRKQGSGDVNRITDVEAVKRSVRNLINTNHFERPFHPEIGGNVRALLFENMTPLTAINLQRKIEEVLSNFEPRAKITQIIADPDMDRNGYRLEIRFYVIGIQNPITVETFLERLR